MSVVRFLGFSTLTCGCVVGRYRDVGSTREIVYVEEKGVGCESHAHRRNQTVSQERERTARRAATVRKTLDSVTVDSQRRRPILLSFFGLLLLETISV
jgi:hypothetical protein